MSNANEHPELAKMWKQHVGDESGDDTTVPSGGKLLYSYRLYCCPKAHKPKPDIPTGAWRDLNKLTLLLGVTTDQYNTWIASNMYNPMWKALYGNVINPAQQKAVATGKRRQPTADLGRAQIAIMRHSSGKNYTAISPDKSKWNTVDHYAHFLWHVRTRNVSRRGGLFYQKGFDVDTVDKLIWQILRHTIHQYTPTKLRSARLAVNNDPASASIATARREPKVPGEHFAMAKDSFSSFSVPSFYGPGGIGSGLGPKNYGLGQATPTAQTNKYATSPFLTGSGCKAIGEGLYPTNIAVDTLIDPALRGMGPKLEADPLQFSQFPTPRQGQESTTQLQPKEESRVAPVEKNENEGNKENINNSLNSKGDDTDNGKAGGEGKAPWKSIFGGDAPSLPA